ncbi:HAD-IA family hydrolase [Streptococcus sp. sy004]|uniref:HAD-IA family hydrolase n=1 Tax=Streptococcus sp. sy004 TaxID=2600149 RepID=UPI0016488575|nr:HAD-IA family hydrolase [Streptococcus sp. sy004]
MEKINFIWDFDGTLVESYTAIMEAMAVLYERYQLEFNEEEVKQVILATSAGHLFAQLAEEHGLDQNELRVFFTKEQEKRDDQVVLLPHVIDALEFTQQMGIQNFIYTHKGSTTQAVLERLGIAKYFVEVVTAVNGFERKPHPEGVNYLLEKYQLVKNETYYIGDRPMDLEVARYAGIKSINFSQETNEFNQKIDSLADLPGLFV